MQNTFQLILPNENEIKKPSMKEDISHLDSLAIAHYVVGGFMVLFSCMPLIHVGLGLSFILGSEEIFAQSGEVPPAFVGWLFFLVGLLFFIFAQAISISVIVSGHFLKKEKITCFHLSSPASHVSLCLLARFWGSLRSLFCPETP